MHELIYTSAPKTLEAPGLGVVAMTSDIPRAIELTMRRLSRFDFFTLPEEQYASPGFQVLSHITMKEASETWHVCSRTLSSGLDYTNRPNFLAHHLAFKDAEIPEGYSVFDVMQINGLFQATWNNEPQILAPRLLPRRDGTKQTSNAWESIQAGKNGARQLLEWYKRREKSFLLNDSPTQTLALFSSATSKVRLEDANKITFCTALGADIQGISYHWMGLIRGSKFAADILSEMPGKVIDTHQAWENVELAPPREPAINSAGELSRGRDSGIKKPKVAGPGNEAWEYDLAAEPSKVRPQTPKPSSVKPADKPSDTTAKIPDPPRPNQNRSQLFIIALSILSVLLFAAVGMGLYALNQWSATKDSLQNATGELAKQKEQTTKEMAGNAELARELEKERRARKAPEANASDTQAVGLPSVTKDKPQAIEPSVAAQPKPVIESPQTQNAERVACVDTDLLKQDKSMAFVLEGINLGIRSVTLLSAEGEIKELSAMEGKYLVRCGNHTVALSLKPYGSADTGTVTSQAISVEWLGDADDSKFPQVPQGRTVLFQLSPKLNQDMKLLVFVVLQKQHEPIPAASLVGTPGKSAQTLEQLENSWKEYVSYLCGSAVPGPTKALKPELTFHPVQLSLPAIGPYKNREIPLPSQPIQLGVGAAEKSGCLNLGTLQAEGLQDIQLGLLLSDDTDKLNTSKSDPSKFTWSLLNAMNAPSIKDMRDSSDTIHLEGALVFEAIGQGGSKVPFPVVCFGRSGAPYGKQLIKPVTSAAENVPGNGK